MSTEEKSKVDDLSVIEEKDGSVTVELPDDIQSPQAEESEDRAQAAADDGGDDDQPDDTDAVREARRARRKAKKEYIKKTNEEKDHRLAMLMRQNQELAERVAIMERKTHGSDIARLDKAIEDEELRIQYFDAKKREAINNSDGEAFTKAQDAWYEARRKVESMKSVKQQAIQSSAQESGSVNPKLIRHANNWMERNGWYDPNGDDEDSAIARIIDNKLVKEGWDPSTGEYWEEFDNRLQKRLPHRYTQSYDESPRRSKPRSFVTGSERESSASRGGGNTFVLEPEQVRAMKEAGFWDDPEKRARMIKRYALEARNNRG
jgi:hypothetical protein